MHVQAWAERRDGSGCVKVTEGLFTYCAIDENSCKRPVPSARD
jgi:acyl-CoA hydrolase